MNLTYQHANPNRGGGSYLLRFGANGPERTPCVLVDSGSGVDLDAMLGPDEYLAAVLLTHAHLDHYVTLSESVRDGAPVYAAAPTADILEHVLVEGEKNYDIGGSAGVLDALSPIDGWETLCPDVEAHPVPAGHAPGAAGFLLRFEDGTRVNTVLVTGDFTTRPAADYRGLPTDLPVGVDVLFVNVSTTDDFPETLTDSLFTLVERAQAGSTVLATASGLTGVHYAYLLGHLGERLREQVPVTLAGQAAKLYADLDYDVPNVETVPVFDDPGELLARGQVTIAGPEVPVEGGARRLYDAMKHDSAGTLVQLTGGATDPVETASCTVYDFEVVNHTSADVIDDLVAELDPIHVVAGHGSRRGLRRYRGRYDERFVWASDDDREQTLYADGRWSAPPWLSDQAVQSIRARDWRENGTRFADLAETVTEKLPPVGRSGDPDLEAEGVAVEQFEHRFGERSATSDEHGVVPATKTGADAGDGDDATVERDGDVEDEGSASVEADAEAAQADSDTPSLPDFSSVVGDRDLEDLASDQAAFRRAVLSGLASLDGLDAVAASNGRVETTARVVEADEDVALLHLGDVDLAGFDHGDEVRVVLEGGQAERDD